jgi:hypothetical protein
VVHDDVFAQDAPDEAWLGAPGFSASITKDRQLRYRPRERAAALTAGRPVFILAGGNLRAEVMAEILVKALPRMTRFVRRKKGPWVVRINSKGELSSRARLRPAGSVDFA